MGPDISTNNTVSPDSSAQPQVSETLAEARRAQAEFFKTFRELQVIAQRVGGDWGMTVRVGRPGEGSFHNPEDLSITLDPLHILEDPDFARFVTGHEGSHRATMCSTEELGLSESQTEALYGQIGFGFGQNITEDGACNDWKDRSFPGLEEGSRRFYEKQFADNDAVLSTPDVNQVAARIGRMPLFARYGSEILRDWNELRKKYGVDAPLPLDEPGNFSPTTPDLVREALERSIKSARRCINSIPDPLCRSKPQIKQAHQTRFKINTDEIFPEIKALADRDLGIETGRQAYNEFRQKVDQLGELEKQKASQSTAQQQQTQEQIDQLKQELAPFDSIPESVREEIERQIQESIKKQLKDFANRLENSAQEIGDSKAKQAQLEKEIAKNQDAGNQGAESQQAENLKDLEHALDLEKAREKAARSKLDKTLQQNIDQSSAGQQLSDQLKQAVEQAAEEKARSSQQQSSDGEQKGEAGKNQQPKADAAGNSPGFPPSAQQGQSSAGSEGDVPQSAASSGMQSGQQSSAGQSAQGMGQASGTATSDPQQVGGAKSGKNAAADAKPSNDGQQSNQPSQSANAGNDAGGQSAGAGEASQMETGNQSGDKNDAASEQAGSDAGAQQAGNAGAGQNATGDSAANAGTGKLQDQILDKLSEKAFNERKEQGQLPLPFEDLSQEAQDEIEKMVAKLPDPQFEECKQRAEDQLKNFERAANAEIGSKLSDQPGSAGQDSKQGQQNGADSQSADSGKSSNSGSNQQSQGGSGDSSGDVEGLAKSSAINLRPQNKGAAKPQIRKVKAEERRADPQEIERHESAIEERAAIEEITRAVSTDPEEYTLAEESIGQPLTVLKRVFRRALRPTEDHQQTSGHPSGRLDVGKAMRLEREPNLVNELFSQHVEPLKIDHAFGTLVDRSASMEGEKSWEAYKGAVLQSKLLDWDQLKIPNTVWVFSDRAYKVKEFGEKITSEEVKNKLGAILQVQGGTNDAPALKAMYKSLLERREKFKFLVVLTDAESGMAEELKKVVRTIKKEGKVVLVHFGLGPNTTDKNGIYPYSFGELSVADAEYGGRNFAQVYKAFIEAAVRKADRFFDYRNTDDIINAIERKAFGSSSAG